jgi:hypothetical protein
MKNLYSKWLWVKWKLFLGIEDYTCYYITQNLGTEARDEYSSLMTKRYTFGRACSLEGLWESGEIGVHYRQARRDLMWRFLWRGERA